MCWSTARSSAPTSTAPAVKGGAAAQAPVSCADIPPGDRAKPDGRSRGGLSSKLHLAVDALGNPLRLLLTPGQTGDVTVARALIEGLRPSHVVADAAYDAGYFREAIAAAGGHAVIASNPSRARRIPWDKALYRERNLGERCFLRLKNFRRGATRYDKTASSFLAFVTVAACAILWK